MPTNLPSLRDLRYLVSLYETKSFSKAAEMCYVGQPTLSSSIRKLEEQLDVKLVERDTHNIKFTEQGINMVRASVDLLEKAEEMINEVTGSIDPFKGRLVIGCIPTLAPYVLPKIIRHFRKQYPNLELYLTENYTHVMLQELQSGMLDVLILAFPFDLSGFPSRVLFKDVFHLIKHKHRDISNAMLKDLNQLPEHSVLLMEEAHCLRAQALHACQLKDSRTVMPFKATSLCSLIQMVDQDLGVSFLPEIAITGGVLKHTQIEALPLGKNAYREVGLVWRKHFNRLAVCDELADILVEG